MAKSKVPELPRMERVALADIRPRWTRETNPNKMEEAQFLILVSQIMQEGFFQSILMRDVKTGPNLIDGHHRVEAAAEAGLTEVWALIVPKTMSEEKARALAIGMNRLRGELDIGMVVGELAALQVDTGWSYDQLALLTGYSQSELDTLLSVENDASLEALGAAPLEADDDILTGKGAFVLELEFQDREAYTLARKRLRRAAGKGQPLSAGLLQLLAIDAETD